MSRDGRESSNSPCPPLAADVLKQIVAFCDRFKKSWKEDQKPRIEDYVAAAPEEQRPRLLRELLLLDVELRYRDGQVSDPEDYRRRFPELDSEAVSEAFRTHAYDRAADRVIEPPDAQPVRLGRYDVMGLVGRGGMGIVYRVHDPKLDRDLALKVMHRECQDEPGLCRRFVEESQVMGQLQHPGVPPVFDRDELPDGSLYYTMKLVHGRTWQALLKDRTDPTHDLPRFLAVFEQVAQTVAYAHSKHVLHRDLKPTNVMVGRFGEVQVMDWGTSKVLGSPVPDEPTESAPVSVVQTVRSRGRDSDTQAGTAMGTFAYMPPEQAEGEIDKVDECADVFALGSILCEVLTGAPAYTGRHRDEVRRKSLRGDLAGALTRLDDSGADPELVTLAKDCLAHERLDRPRDASIVSQRISAHLAAVQEQLEAAKMAGVAAKTKAAEERKRRYWQLSLAAVVLVVLALGGVGLAMGQNRLTRADSLFDLATKLCEQAEGDPAGGDPMPASAALKQAQEALGELARLRQSRISMLQDRISGIGKLSALLLRLESIRSDHSERSDANQTDRDYTRAFLSFGLDLDTIDPEWAGVILARYAAVVEIAAALDEWAWVRSNLPQSQGPASWRRLIEVARAADRDERRDVLRARFGKRGTANLQAIAASEDLRAWPAASLGLLSRALEQSGNRDQAVAVLWTAWRSYPGDFWANFDLGEASWNDSSNRFENPAEAVRFLTAAVAIRPTSALAHTSLGNALTDQGKLAEAEAEYREAIRLKPDYADAHTNLDSVLRAQGKQAEATRLNPDSAEANIDRGNALRARGRPAEAEAEFREAIRLKPDQADAHIGLGFALRAQGKLAEAEAECREAIRLEPDQADAHSSLGFVLWDQGELVEAEAEFREAIRLSPGHGDAHIGLGSALRDRGRPAEAEAEFREVIRSSPGYVDAHIGLGNALRDQGRLTEAEAECREATRISPDYAYAHLSLGNALRKQGELEEALAAFRRAAQLAPPGSALARNMPRDLHLLEKQIALDRRLPAVLKGDDKLTDAVEGLAFAQLCYDKDLHTSAARLWAVAFAADPKSVDDRQTQPRYNAACSAALAGSGKSEDDPPPDEVARAKLRAQSLDWLRAELVAWSKLINSGTPQDREMVRKTLARWKVDTDLAGIRDEPELARLPEAEREDLQGLWHEVDALLMKAGGTSP